MDNSKNIEQNILNEENLISAYKGQMLINACIAFAVLGSALLNAYNLIVYPLWLVALPVAFWGIVLLTKVASDKVLVRLLLLLSLLIPLLNLIIMYYLSRSVTQKLKKAGYKFGLLSISKKNAA